MAWVRMEDGVGTGTMGDTDEGEVRDRAGDVTCGSVGNRVSC